MRFCAIFLALNLLALPTAAQDHDVGATRTGALAVPRLGFLVAGGGEAESDCTSSGTLQPVCTQVEMSDTDYDDESGFGFGLDVLGNLSNNVRLGGGVWFVPDTELEGDPGGDTDFGSDLTLSFVAEGLIDMTPGLALVGRVQLGGLILFPGDDIDDTIDQLQTSCDQLEAAGFSCDFNDGPYLGPSFGGGIGVLGELGRVALRGDFIAQWYSFDLVGIDVSGAGGDYEASVNLTGTRFWLTAALEF